MDEILKTIAIIVGAGGAGSILTITTRYWINRRKLSQEYDLRADQQQHEHLTETIERQEKRIVLLEKMHAECLKSHAESMASNADIYAKLETMWDHFMLSTKNELVEKGMAKMNSPLGFTPGARQILADMVVNLVTFYLTITEAKPDITEMELFMEFDKEFGDLLVNKLTKTHGLSRGACLVMAIGVCRLSLTVKI